MLSEAHISSSIDQAQYTNQAKADPLLPYPFDEFAFCAPQSNPENSAPAINPPKCP
jgi:hypothetical protein